MEYFLDCKRFCLVHFFFIRNYVGNKLISLDRSLKFVDIVGKEFEIFDRKQYIMMLSQISYVKQCGYDLDQKT